MIKKFNQFVSENVNEGVMGPSEMGKIVTEACKSYESDDNEEHTFEAYVTEMLMENKELCKVVEGIFPNLAKKTGLTGIAADAVGMPRGTGLDAD